MLQLLVTLIALLSARRNVVEALTPPTIAGCDVFPADSWWNTPIDNLPVHQHSTAWINIMGPSRRLKADFGNGLWEGAKIGIPFLVVPSNQPVVPISYQAYGRESDPGPWPIPLTAPIEGEPNTRGDRHVIVLQQGTCKVFEIYRAFAQQSEWHADSGAEWDLSSHAFRPLGWTSADAAGLPILPGLVRYDEIVEGEIKHAIRFTTSLTQRLYVWPASHYASYNTSWFVPPMGARFRLKQNFDISTFSPTIQIILRALKKYGLVLADNGSSWYMSGVPDERWSNSMLNSEFQRVLGQHMEAVDVSSLMISPSSGQVNTAPTPPTITKSPTKAPTSAPIITKSPTKAPTSAPIITKSPTKAPTPAPTTPTTKRPTRRPTRRRRRRGLENSQSFDQ